MVRECKYRAHFTVFRGIDTDFELELMTKKVKTKNIIALRAAAIYRPETQTNKLKLTFSQRLNFV